MYSVRLKRHELCLLALICLMFTASFVTVGDVQAVYTSQLDPPKNTQAIQNNQCALHFSSIYSVVDPQHKRMIVCDLWNGTSIAERFVTEGKVNRSSNTISLSGECKYAVNSICHYLECLSGEIGHVSLGNCTQQNNDTTCSCEYLYVDARMEPLPNDNTTPNNTGNVDNVMALPSVKYLYCTYLYGQLFNQILAISKCLEASRILGRTVILPHFTGGIKAFHPFLILDVELLQTYYNVVTENRFTKSLLPQLRLSGYSGDLNCEHLPRFTRMYECTEETENELILCLGSYFSFWLPIDPLPAFSVLVPSEKIRNITEQLIQEQLDPKFTGVHMRAMEKQCEEQNKPTFHSNALPIENFDEIRKYCETTWDTIQLRLLQPRKQNLTSRDIFIASKQSPDTVKQLFPIHVTHLGTNNQLTLPERVFADAWMLFRAGYFLHYPSSTISAAVCWWRQAQFLGHLKLGIKHDIEPRSDDCFWGWINEFGAFSPGG